MLVTGHNIERDIVELGMFFEKTQSHAGTHQAHNGIADGLFADQSLLFCRNRVNVGTAAVQVTAGI